VRLFSYIVRVWYSLILLGCAAGPKTPSHPMLTQAPVVKQVERPVGHGKAQHEIRRVAGQYSPIKHKATKMAKQARKPSIKAREKPVEAYKSNGSVGKDTTFAERIRTLDSMTDTECRVFCTNKGMPATLAPPVEDTQSYDSTLPSPVHSTQPDGGSSPDAVPQDNGR